MDDARFDGFNGTLSDGRPGEKVGQFYEDWLVGHFSGLRHGTTRGPCWPGRCEWMTGLWAWNHGCNTAAEGGTVQNYLDVYVNGITTERGGYLGPWMKDLAGRAGAPRWFVNDARVKDARGAGDHLQAQSGDIFNWLDREGVHCGIFGKYQNGFSDASVIPPGVTFAKLNVLDAAGATNQWQSHWKEFSGANPWDGDGADSGSTVVYSYSRTGTMSWADGKAQLHGSGTYANMPHAQVGDEVYIDCPTYPGYNGYHTITDVIDNHTIKYALANDPGGSAGCDARVTPEYNVHMMARWFTEWLDTLGDNDPWFAYVCPHQPHENGSGTYTQSCEIKYETAVDPADAMYFGGEPGGLSPTSEEPTQLARDDWSKRAGMMASCDDMLKTMVQYCEARWGDDFTVIFVTDQGQQQGEQAARGDGGIKTAIWEGSHRSMLEARGPRLPNLTINQATCHADIPLTILDLFGIRDHHAHTTRDGISLLRVIKETHPAHDRMVPVYGVLGGASAEGLETTGGMRFLRASGNNATGNFYDPVADWELLQRKPDGTPGQCTAGERATWGGYVEQYNAARFDPDTGTNPANDGSLP